MDDKTGRLIELICETRKNPICRIMVQQLVKTMEDICERCQADRRVLLLDPLCYGRFYLSLLIEAGVSPSSIPSDCYRIRLEEIKKILSNRAVAIPTKDAVIKLKDFVHILAEIEGSEDFGWGVVHAKSVDEFIDILKRIIVNNRNFSYRKSDEKLYILLGKSSRPILCVVDLDKGTVLIDPEERFPSICDLEPLSSLLMSFYGLDGILYSSPLGNTYLQIFVDRDFDVATIQDFSSNIGMAVMDTKNGKIISIRIAEEGSVVVNYHTIFRLLNAFQ